MPRARATLAWMLVLLAAQAYESLWVLFQDDADAYGLRQVVQISPAIGLSLRLPIVCGALSCVALSALLFVRSTCLRCVVYACSAVVMLNCVAYCACVPTEVLLHAHNLDKHPALISFGEWPRSWSSWDRVACANAFGLLPSGGVWNALALAVIPALLVRARTRSV